MEFGQVDGLVATLGVTLSLEVLQDNLLTGPQGVQSPEENPLVYFQDFLALCQERVERIVDMTLIGELVENVKNAGLGPEF